jgi:O-antigen/teichoic acid export membrane protein
MSEIIAEQSNDVQAPMAGSWLKRSAFALYASKIIASIAMLGAGVLLLRYLDPSEYGFYQVVISISSFTSLVFGFGFSPVIARFVPELLERGNSRAAARFVVITLGSRVVLISILLPLGLLFFGSIEDAFGLQHINEYGAAVTAAVVLGVYLGSSVGPVVLSSYARQTEVGIVAVISSVLRVLTIVFVVAMDFGLIGILTAISFVEITMMLGYLIRIFVIVRSTTAPSDMSDSGSVKKRAIKFSLPNSLMSAVGFFEGRFGMVFVISSSLGTAAVGNYSFVLVMLQFGSILNPIYTLSSLIDHVIVRRSVHVDQKLLLARGQRVFLTMTIYTGLPVALYLLLLRAPLSQVFGFEQAGTGWLFLWSGMFFVVNSLKLAYGNIFTQLEVPKYRVLFGGIGIVGVGLAFFVVDTYGIIGVAAVAAGVSLFVLFLQHWISRRILGVPVGIYPVVWIKILVINALAGAATWTVVSVSERFIVIFVVSSLVFCSIYAVGTILIKPFSAEDTKLLRMVIPTGLPKNLITIFR